MTVLASNLDRGAWLVVEIAVAVRVLSKMAVNTMHPFVEMNIVQVNGLFEFIRIVRRNQPALRIEQISFPIALEDFPKQPTVTMKITELRIPEEQIELGRAGRGQEIKVGPETAQTGGFRISIQLFLFFRRRRIVLLFRIQLVAVALVV